MKILVCGGRHYEDRAAVERILTALDPDEVVTGGATGVDFWAYNWARNTGLIRHVYPANWDRHGRAAGPIRNQVMLDREEPDLVVVFPGGRGTADMARKAEEAGVKIKRIV